MDYETMDWEDEAKRVASAFGVREECEFVEDKWGQKVLRGTWDGQSPAIAPEICLLAAYTSEYRDFSMANCDHGTYVRIFWDGRKPEIECGMYEEAVAHSLLLLGLLSPEIEAALGATFSAHQKLEWLVDFEEKLQNNQRLRRWNSARWVRIAFGLERGVEYDESGADMDVLEARLSDGVRLRVEEFDQVAWFSLQNGERATVIGVDWYGRVIQQPTQFDFAKQLAKGLMYLYSYPDFSEIEKALKLEISESERLEWKQEYKSRYEF